MANDRPSFSRIVVPIMCTAIMGSYAFGWTTYQSALAADKGIKHEVREQAKDVKKDLNDRLDRLDKRINQALQNIQKSLDRNSPPPTPNR